MSDGWHFNAGANQWERWRRGRVIEVMTQRYVRDLTVALHLSADPFFVDTGDDEPGYGHGV